MDFWKNRAVSDKAAEGIEAPRAFTKDVTEYVANRVAEAEKRMSHEIERLISGRSGACPVNSFTRKPLLRLEPNFAEVKQVMKDMGMTEKSAEKAVRKALLQNALYQVGDEIADRRLIEIARAMLALI